MLGRNSMKWFQTDQSTPSDESVQGKFYAYSGQTILTINMIIEYELEFTNPIPSTVTLSRLALKSTEDAIFGSAIDGLTREERIALIRRLTGCPERSSHKEGGSNPPPLVPYSSLG